MTGTIERLKCIYCTPLTAVYNRQNKKTGVYKVMITATNHLIFICVRCHGRMKGLFMGTFLSEQDMNPDELKTLEGKQYARRRKSQTRKQL